MWHRVNLLTKHLWAMYGVSGHKDITGYNLDSGLHNQQYDLLVVWQVVVAILEEVTI